MKFMYYNMYQLLYGSTIFLLAVAIFFEFLIFFRLISRTSTRVKQQQITRIVENNV